MSSSTSFSQKKTTGFSEKDVNTFLQRGDTLATDKSRFESPSEKTKTTLLRREKGRTTEEGTKGFLGKFSDITPERLETLKTTFKQRETNIAQRQTQPGRASLFMGRS